MGPRHIGSIEEGEPISDRITLNESQASGASRIAWIDYGKGISIILVVMMHSTLGVEAALDAKGAMRLIVDFAAPFRVPAFFLMSGLLLSRTIKQPWPVYLDRKVLHFAYFYLLWLAINCVIKFGLRGVGATLDEFLFGLIEPFGTLWFIYILPFFFVATKLARHWPVILFSMALSLNLLAPHSGWGAIDEFASRFVFFIAGYLGVRYAMALADWVAANKSASAFGLAMGAGLAGLIYFSGWAGWKTSPGLLALAFAGSAAVIAVSSLLAQGRWLESVRHCGQNSLTIYLAFFLPMAATRELIVRFAPEIGPTAASFIVTAAALIAPLVMERVTRATPLRYLFHRPVRLHAAPIGTSSLKTEKPPS
ncbi:MAG: acyltransferase family protein [Beijerinckiaceae bacterium]|nr:acyltransferase family protein [Beijerinckiaceae bacterium]